MACYPHRSQYARHLLDVAAELTSREQPQPAALAMARGSQVERRIAAILSSTCRRTPPPRSIVAGMCVVAIIGALIVASVSPFTALKGGEVDGAKASAQNESKEKNLHTFLGRVVFVDGVPAAGARVRSLASGTDSPSVSTVADAAGNYELVLSASNFHPPLIAELAGELGFAQIALEANLQNKSTASSLADITLKASKRIEVEVVDQTEKPVSDAVLYVQERQCSGRSRLYFGALPQGLWESLWANRKQDLCYAATKSRRLLSTT